MILFGGDLFKSKDKNFLDIQSRQFVQRIKGDLHTTYRFNLHMCKRDFICCPKEEVRKLREVLVRNMLLDKQCEDSLRSHLGEKHLIALVAADRSFPLLLPLVAINSLKSVATYAWYMCNSNFTNVRTTLFEVQENSPSAQSNFAAEAIHSSTRLTQEKLQCYNGRARNAYPA